MHTELLLLLLLVKIALSSERRNQQSSRQREWQQQHREEEKNKRNNCRAIETIIEKSNKIAEQKTKVKGLNSNVRELHGAKNLYSCDPIEGNGELWSWERKAAAEAAAAAAVASARRVSNWCRLSVCSFVDAIRTFSSFDAAVSAFSFRFNSFFFPVGCLKVMNEEAKTAHTTMDDRNYKRVNQNDTRKLTHKLFVMQSADSLQPMIFFLSAPRLSSLRTFPSLLLRNASDTLECSTVSHVSHYSVCVCALNVN